MAEAVVLYTVDLVMVDLVIDKIISLTLSESELELYVKYCVDDLRNTISAIKARLLDAGERSATSNFTVWLKKLKDALCDAWNLLEEFSSEFRRKKALCSGWITSFAIFEMCFRLASLESEFKIPFKAGTRQQGHFFVHKDEEQSVTDYSFQGRLKVQKDLENMPVDSFSTAFQEVCWCRTKTMEKIHETFLYEKMGYGMAESEHQFLSNGSKKRNLEFVSDDLRQEAERKKKQRDIQYQRQIRAKFSDALRQEAERKKKQRGIQHWRQKIAKFYDDPTERGINNNGKITNWRCKWERMVEMLAMENNMRKLKMLPSMKMENVLKVTNIGKTKASQQVVCRRNQIKMQWPMQPNLVVIIRLIEETDRKCKNAVLAEPEAKGQQILKGEKIEKLDRQRPGFFHPSLWKVEVSAVDDKTREGVQSKFRDLENQLYDKGNDKVECKDFLGLEQALKSTSWGKIPDYLKPIAIQIEKDRGKTTDVFHIPTEVLLCAAIKEMKDFSVGDLDLSTLKKWSATLNYAKKYGFQVGFADNMLKKNLLAYFAIQNLPKSTVKI